MSRDSNSLICPHCGHEHEDAWDHSWGRVGGGSIETECDKCEKRFVARQEISTTYITTKIGERE